MSDGILPTQKSFRDLTGKTFRYFTVTSFAGIKSIGTRRRYMWNCVCSCGCCKEVRADNVKNGSCGCQQKQKARERGFIHGHSASPEYNCWRQMKYRCQSRGCESYSSYGGRGITVCDRWQVSFENFLSDMGYRPSSQHSLDRIDNDGSYCPENCRWATKRQQSSNRRNTVFVDYLGKRKTVDEWSEDLGINKMTLIDRLKRVSRGGISIEKAMTPISRSE